MLVFGATNLTNSWRPVRTELHISRICFHPKKQVFCKVEHVEIRVLPDEARIIPKSEDPCSRKIFVLGEPRRPEVFSVSIP